MSYPQFISPTADYYVKRSEVDGLMFSTVEVTDKALGGSIGSAATTVDIASTINIDQDTAGQTLTVPSLTNTALSKEITVNNVGSTSYIMLSTTVAPGSGILLSWTGSAWSVIGTSSGASNVVVVGGKTFTVDNTLELAGTDGTVMTFPSTSQTIVGLTATQTLTNKTLTAPVMTTPTLGVASATTVNKVALTAPATGSTLTIADGKTLTANASITLTSSGDAGVMTFPNATDTVVTLAATQTLTNKTLTSPTMTAPVLGVATGTSVAVSGLLTSSSATAQVGFATGAGGAVSQSTDKSTGVTLNTNCGAITMDNAELAGAATVSFTLTNSAIAATDVVVVSVKSGASTGLYTAAVTAVGAGSCVISVTNVGATASEVVVINFAVISAVSS